MLFSKALKSKKWRISRIEFMNKICISIECSVKLSQNSPLLMTTVYKIANILSKFLWKLLFNRVIGLWSHNLWRTCVTIVRVIYRKNIIFFDSKINFEIILSLNWRINLFFKAFGLDLKNKTRFQWKYEFLFRYSFY